MFTQSRKAAKEEELVLAAWRLCARFSFSLGRSFPTLLFFSFLSYLYVIPFIPF
jgi:hypothetical protein